MKKQNLKELRPKLEEFDNIDTSNLNFGPIVLDDEPLCIMCGLPLFNTDTKTINYPQIGEVVVHKDCKKI